MQISLCEIVMKLLTLGVEQKGISRVMLKKIKKIGVILEIVEILKEIMKQHKKEYLESVQSMWVLYLLIRMVISKTKVLLRIQERQLLSKIPVIKYHNWYSKILDSKIDLEDKSKKNQRIQAEQMH